MNIQQPKVDLKNNFELFLEGIKVDFLSITISEREGNIPAASIVFPSTHNILRILPGTIVQIFGYYYLEDKYFLLFEGEVTGVNMQKTNSNQIASLNAISLLGSMIKAKFRPSDAIIIKDLKDATGVQATQIQVYNNKGENSSIGQTATKDLKNIKNQKSTIINGTSKDKGVSAVFGLVDEFSQMLDKDQPGGKGDFIPMLQNFNIYFENNDLFYGLRSLAYKFGRTVFASPNPELLNKIKVDLFYEVMNKLKSGISDAFGETPYTLMHVLTEFQRYLHYNFISPASYTACKPFYISTIPKNWEPLRIIYTPRLEIGPPALCNIFFPEQVNRTVYSRDMMEEPTRVVGRSVVPLLNSVNRVIDFSPVAVYPELEFNDKVASANFTTEETYRGINYRIINYTNLQSDVISKKVTTTEKGKKTTKYKKINSEEMEKGEIGYLIRSFTYMDYLNLRYATRSLSIEGEWNPYRMVGLPGLLLDSEGISIVGVVASIDTTISAQGQAYSNIGFRNVRIVFDGDFENSVFSKIPADNQENLEKYVIHDLTNDGMLATNELLYNQELYSFENIGKDVYTYITNGMLSPNQGFLKIKNKYDVFSYTNDKLENKNFDFNVYNKNDSSVLFFLPTKEGKYDFEIPEVYTKKTEIKNTYLLYKAIKELRKAYEQKKYKIVNNEKQYDMKQVYDFIYAINRRNVITKESYFNFIGANINRSSLIEDAHDSKIIFEDGIEKLREIIKINSKEQYEKIIDSKILNSEISKKKLTKLKRDLESLINEKNDYIKSFKYQNTENNVAFNNKIKEYDTNINNLQKDINELEKSSKNNTIEPNVTVLKEAEFYKPFNITRRMHVIYALKDLNELIINNDKLKLTVMK